MSGQVTISIVPLAAAKIKEKLQFCIIQQTSLGEAQADLCLKE
jgi:hypothetical protein